MIALQGAREVRSGCGLTFDDDRRGEAYDAGRELMHLITFRHFDW